MLRLTCPGVSRLAPLSDQLPPIFLGGQPAAHGRELLLGLLKKSHRGERAFATSW